MFKDYYQGKPFIRIVEGSPNLAVVQKSNFVDIAIHLKDNYCVVFCALDNLLKGAAGQAVQNMNIMLGLPENQGLNMIGGYP